MLSPVFSRQTNSVSLWPDCQYIPSGITAQDRDSVLCAKQQEGKWDLCPGPLNETLQCCIYRKSLCIFNVEEGTGPQETFLLRHTTTYSLWGQALVSNLLETANQEKRLRFNSTLCVSQGICMATDTAATRLFSPSVFPVEYHFLYVFI